MGEEIEELWDGLNLGGLLNDLQRENDALVKAQRMKDPFRMHNKIVRSPAYAVLMDRYNTKPNKPKILAKKTLERLADPVKGRIYQSPPKIQHTDKKVPVNNSPPTKRMERYHSPIRRDINDDDDDDPPVHKLSPAPSGKNESDSFFLTGTGHGEIETTHHNKAGISSTNMFPTMNVRVELAPHRRLESPPRSQISTPTAIYSPKTREYLHDAILKGSVDERHIEILRNTRKMENEIPAKGIKQKTEKFGKEGRRKGEVTMSRGSRTGSGAAGELTRKGKPRLKGEPKSLIQGKSKALGSELRKIGRVVPVAGIGARRTKGQAQGEDKTRAGKQKGGNPLEGMERVDSNPLLRSNSAGVVGRDRAERGKGRSLVGSRSAPSISHAKKLAVTEDESGQKAYGLHPLPASRMLGKGSRIAKKHHSEQLVKAGVRLQPIVPTRKSYLQSEVVKGKGERQISLPKEVGRERGGPLVPSRRPPVSDLRGGAPLGSSRGIAISASSDLADDNQMAALFASHARKLSESLEKASSISSQYKRLKEYDGLSATTRSAEMGSEAGKERPENRQTTPSRQERSTLIC